MYGLVPLVLSRPSGRDSDPMFRLGSALLTTGRSDEMKTSFSFAPR